MKFALATLLCLSTGFGQNAADLFTKAPPDVDAAIRQRIHKFYQAHVDRKLRDADSVVADDSRDLFFEIDKPRYFGFDIVTVTYEENFTKAKAVVAVDVDWKHPRMGRLRVKQPVTSLWKMENGEWWWYMLPTTERQTAFGTMKPGPDGDGGSPVMDALKGVSMGDVLAGVRMSTNELRLKSHEPSSAEVKIRNGLPGKVALKLGVTTLKGLEARLLDNELDPGQETTLVVSHNPMDRNPKPRTTIKVEVEQTRQTLPLNIIFELAPEHEKLVPRNQ